MKLACRVLPFLLFFIASPMHGGSVAAVGPPPEIDRPIPTTQELYAFFVEHHDAFVADYAEDPDGHVAGVEALIPGPPATFEDAAAVIGDAYDLNGEQAALALEAMLMAVRAWHVDHRQSWSHELLSGNLYRHGGHLGRSALAAAPHSNLARLLAVQTHTMAFLGFGLDSADRLVETVARSPRPRELADALLDLGYRDLYRERLLAWAARESGYAPRRLDAWSRALDRTYQPFSWPLRAALAREARRRFREGDFSGSDGDRRAIRLYLLQQETAATLRGGFVAEALDLFRGLSVADQRALWSGRDDEVEVEWDGVATRLHFEDLRWELAALESVTAPELLDERLPLLPAPDGSYRDRYFEPLRDFLAWAAEPTPDDPFDLFQNAVLAERQNGEIWRSGIVREALARRAFSEGYPEVAEYFRHQHQSDWYRDAALEDEGLVPRNLPWLPPASRALAEDRVARLTNGWPLQRRNGISPSVARSLAASLAMDQTAPRAPTDAESLDPDGDGLTNREEAYLLTDPTHPDSDDDGLLDGEDPLPHVPYRPGPATPRERLRAEFLVGEEGPIALATPQPVERARFLVSSREGLGPFHPRDRVVVLESAEARAVRKADDPHDSRSWKYLDLLMTSRDGKTVVVFRSGVADRQTTRYEKRDTGWSSDSVEAVTY